MHTRTGLDVVLESNLDLLRGERIGVIANPASVNARLQHIVDLLFQHPELELTCVLGPQHGARGETQDNMIEWTDYRDSVTGLPVFSLYSSTRKPTPEMLKNVDVLVFDVQDVGARYYTFIYTMALAMQACRELGKRFVVLDRPNPIGGTLLEGPVLDPEFASFVGLYPLAIRHGMTVGELALYFNSEFGIGCQLEVIPMEGWTRELLFDETGLPWVFPSPNIPTPETALVYPGMCLFEGTNVSEGRGTTLPFELSGAPWVEPERMVSRLAEFEIPGVRFRPVHFIPTFHKWMNELIGGVQIHVTDPRKFKPFTTGLALLIAYREMGPGQFSWNAPPYEYENEKLPIDILFGTDSIRKMIETGVPLPEIIESWQADLSRFKGTREQYLLYP